jgi:hypothetical protein
VETANYRRKHPNVFARKAEGDMTVMHNIKGEQHAKKGDWLVGTEKGKIEVFKPAAFEAQFEPIPDGLTAEEELELLREDYRALQEKYESVTRVAHAEEAALDAVEESNGSK